MINDLIQDFSAIEQIEAIAIGGSRASDYSDLNSDYDVYIYYRFDVSKGQRKQILEKYCNTIELDNQFWETEDNCILKNGIFVDLVYRNIDDFLKGIHRVVYEYQASNGYTTCLWHNLIHSHIVFDRHHMLKEAVAKYDISYPEQLRRNIITRNMCLLSGALPSYDEQIKKAVLLKDYNSIQHRTTEFLSSYFDVIFALNKKTHPGEKRLVKICLLECSILPLDFEKNLLYLFQNMFTDLEKYESFLKKMITNLRQTVELNLL